MAFHAAVSLGRLCVVEQVSMTYLITRLPELSPCDKGEVSLYSVDKATISQDKNDCESSKCTSDNRKLRSHEWSS